MSMLEEITNGLAEFNPTRVKIDRAATDKGRPANQITVYFAREDGSEFYSQFNFAHDLKMGAEQMLRVMKSYIKNDLETMA